MRIQLSDLQWAAEKGVISPVQATALWEALATRYEHRPRFSFGHVIYYLGALIILSSMSWFIVTAWETLGGGGILLVAASYGIAFAVIGINFWRRPAYRIPGGLLVAIAVSMTPLAVYGFQRMMGWWPQGDPGAYRDYHRLVKGSWLFMEGATVTAGLLALRWVRFPFITFPIALALWYMSMDLTPMLVGRQEFSWDERKWVSLFFGLVMLVATYFADRRTREDFAFWGYLSGLLAFWGGLTAMESGSEWGKFLYCLINLGLVFLSVFLGRRAFAVFGAAGIFAYFGHLANVVFKDALLFPIALSGLGMGVLYLGVLYQKHQSRIDNWVIRAIPPGLRRLRPTERTG